MVTGAGAPIGEMVVRSLLDDSRIGHILAVELVCEPLEEDASGLSVALTNSGDDVSLVLYGGQIAGVVASQGCLLSSPQTTREEHQSYTKVWQTRPCR